MFLWLHRLVLPSLAKGSLKIRYVWFRSKNFWTVLFAIAPSKPGQFDQNCHMIVAVHMGALQNLKLARLNQETLFQQTLNYGSGPNFFR